MKTANEIKQEVSSILPISDATWYRWLNVLNIKASPIYETQQCDRILKFAELMKQYRRVVPALTVLERGELND